MIFFSKYSLLLLFLANFASQYSIFESVSEVIFYLSIFSGILGLFSSFKEIFIININSCKFIFIIIIIYILYYLTFGIQYWSIGSINYLFARIVTLLIIAEGICTNFKFYYYKVPVILSIVIVISILYGTYNDTTIAEGRFYLGFGNPNSTSAISAMGFLTFLFLKFNKNPLIYIGLIICLWGVIAGGSRTIFALVLLSVLYRFGLSYKLIIATSLGFFLITIILPSLGFNNVAFDRFINVINSNNLIGSREEVREATMIMIKERPIEGWGPKSGIQGEAAQITQLGSHNGYLDLIKALGYPFSFLLFSVMAYYIYKIKDFIFSKQLLDRYFFLIIIVVLLGALYESMLHGVNYMLNTYFYMAITILLYKKNVNLIITNHE